MSEEKKFCEIIVECVFDCPDDERQELQDKIANLIAELTKDKRIMKMGTNMSIFSESDISLSMMKSNQKEEDLN